MNLSGSSNLSHTGFSILRFDDNIPCFWWRTRFTSFVLLSLILPFASPAMVCVVYLFFMVTRTAIAVAFRTVCFSSQRNYWIMLNRLISRNFSLPILGTMHTIDIFERMKAVLRIKSYKVVCIVNLLIYMLLTLCLIQNFFSWSYLMRWNLIVASPEILIDVEWRHYTLYIFGHWADLGFLLNLKLLRFLKWPYILKNC